MLSINLKLKLQINHFELIMFLKLYANHDWIYLIKNKYKNIRFLKVTEDWSNGWCACVRACVYINTHTCMYIFKKNVLCLYIKYMDIQYMDINIYM